MQDYFADAIGNITVIGGTVRIEFVRIASIDSETKQPVYESSHRIVMPIQGFVQSCDRQSALKRKLEEAGLTPAGASIPSSNVNTAASSTENSVPKGRLKKPKV
jgi:hypothetical protein